MTVLCPWQIPKTFASYPVSPSFNHYRNGLSRVFHVCYTSLPRVPPVVVRGLKFWAVQNFVLFHHRRDRETGCHDDAHTWTSYRIRKIVDCACSGNARNVFLPPRVSDPGMHHGTCMTHVPSCIPGSLTSGFFFNRWRGKRSRHSRRMRNPQLCVSGKRPMETLSAFMALLATHSVVIIQFPSIRSSNVHFYDSTLI